MKKYTLIELLVAMGIFAFMMLLLMNFFSISTDLMTRENSRAEKLYEGGTLSMRMRQDLSHIITADAIYNIEYNYGADDPNEIKLRFFSDTWDNYGNRDSGTIMAVSYIYNQEDFTLKRYALTTDPANPDKKSGSYFNASVAPTSAEYTKLESDDHGAILLEGVEFFETLIYESNGYSSFTNVDSSTTGSTEDSFIFDAAPLEHPDAINFKITLNDPDILEDTKSLPDSSDAKKNQRAASRRTIFFQQIMGYKE